VQNFLLFSTEKFVLREAFLEWAKTEKTGSLRLLATVVHSSEAKLLSDKLFLWIDFDAIDAPFLEIEQQENEIVSERNWKRWKARSKAGEETKVLVLFVSKLCSMRSSLKGSFLTAVSRGFRLSAPFSIHPRVIKYYKKLLVLSYPFVDHCCFERSLSQWQWKAMDKNKPR
jgi:hypothetical protein